MLKSETSNVVKKRKGGDFCSAFGCSNSRTHTNGVSYHSFPQDREMQKKWLVALRRKDFAPTKSSKVCSEHFSPSCFKEQREGFRPSVKRILYPNAVPSIFSAYPRHLQSTEKKRTTKTAIASQEIDFSVFMEAENEVTAKVQERLEPVSPSSEPHANCVTKEMYTESLRVKDPTEADGSHRFDGYKDNTEEQQKHAGDHSHREEDEAEMQSFFPGSRQAEETNVEAEDEEEPEEDWERFEALHDDPHNMDRWKERKYEEPLEIVWEKGGPGLVWYTDEQFWREGEKLELFDDPTNYDWDLDMSAYETAGSGSCDADARDLLAMRFGQFERHTRAVGSAVLRSHGWQGPGTPVGATSGSGGLAEPISAEPRPEPKRAGFGYHGERAAWRSRLIAGEGGSAGGGRQFTTKEAALISRARSTGVYVASRYDRPEVRETVDPQDSLLVRANPAKMKYN